LVSSLRPELLGAMWWTLGRIVELALTPLGLLIAWLTSLFPRASRGPEMAPPRPLPDFTPDLAALAQLQDRVGWIGTAIAIALIGAAGIAAILAVRILLASWIGAPPARPPERGPELTVERHGTPRADAAAFWAWLVRLVRGRLARANRSAGSHVTAAAEDASVDAWTAYRRLLAWAEQQGLGRQPAETTGQLQARLSRQVPESAETVGVVTRTYEWHRYGGRHPPR
jgi:hypothetical protein